MNQVIKLIFASIVASVLMGCGEKVQEGAAATPATSGASEQTPQATPQSTVDAASLYKQGLALRDSQKGPDDLAKAFELFTKAAELGDRDAMFFLGVMYEHGESVPVDQQKALEWYEKSDKLGNGSAGPNMKALKAKMAKKK